MRIIPATEAITVANPKVVIYGPPGIGKSTIKNMTRRMLSMDFDEGEHRATNRQDSVRPAKWQDVEELLSDKAVLEGYDTLGSDTVARCLDLLSYDIIEKTPKYGRGGVLTQQGWGELKSRFKGYKERLDRCGKDVVWIAHEKEEKDGEVRIVRPDIQGSSYGLILQSADLVGYLYKDGRERVLSFEPTDRWHAKGPAGWGRIVVPDTTKAPAFLSDLIDRARGELGRVSQESATVAAAVADWAVKVDEVTTPEELTDLVPAASALGAPMLKAQVRELLSRKAKEKAWKWDAKASAYMADKPATTPPSAPEPEPVGALSGQALRNQRIYE